MGQRSCLISIRSVYPVDAKLRLLLPISERSISWVKKAHVSRTSLMLEMLVLSKRRRLKISIRSYSSKRMSCTNLQMLQPSSAMRETLFQDTPSMQWANSTMLGLLGKHRKKHGGTMGYHQRKPMFGRPSTGFVFMMENHSRKVHDFQESIHEPTKLTVTQQ